MSYVVCRMSGWPRVRAQLALMGHQQDGGRFEGCRARRESGIRAIALSCAFRHRRTQSMRVALQCCDAHLRTRVGHSASKIAAQGPQKREDGGGKTAPRGCESREGETPQRSVSSVLVLGESRRPCLRHPSQSPYHMCAASPSLGTVMATQTTGWQFSVGAPHQRHQDKPHSRKPVR